MRRPRGRNTTGVARLGFGGMGTPGQFSLCPNVEDWKRHTVSGEGHLEALLAEARNRAARGEDVGAMFHRLTKRERRMLVDRLTAEGAVLAPDADLVEAWRRYARSQ